MQTVAVVQAGTVLGDQGATLRKFETLVGECSKRQATIAVFPEAFIGGYPKGLLFGISLGIRTDEGRKLFQEYASGAIEIPGPVTETLCRVAQEHSMHLVVGVVERAGGTLYCTAVYLGADGTLLGKHRKLMPTALERAIWGCGDGSTLRVVDSSVGKFGALMCWENYMPLARMAMYEQGIELYCAPTVDDREVWVATMRHVAREGRCFVLNSCQFLRREAYPSHWLKESGEIPDPAIRGGSCIIGPLGDILAPPLYGEEGVLAVDVDRGKLMAAKFDLDVAGHYARPDVFAFSVIQDRK